MGDTGREELQRLGAFWERAQKITTWGEKNPTKTQEKVLPPNRRENRGALTAATRQLQQGCLCMRQSPALLPSRTRTMPCPHSPMCACHACCSHRRKGKQGAGRGESVADPSVQDTQRWPSRTERPHSCPHWHARIWLRYAEKDCTSSLDYEFPLGLNLGKSVIQGRKHRDVAVNRGDHIKPCTQPPYKADPRRGFVCRLCTRCVPRQKSALPVLRVSGRLSPGGAATGSTRGSLCPKEGNAKHKSPTSPGQRCSCQTRAPGGTNKQTRRCRQGGQSTLRIWGIF